MAGGGLNELFDKRQVITDPVELITFEVDAGFDRGQPEAVVLPESSADVSRLMRWAVENAKPVVARGAGTGLSGGAVAEHGGVILGFSRMDRVLDFDATGRSAVVEPGVVNLRLDALAKEHGLYYPPDPSSGRASVIGGNLGENAGGPHCFKYGVTTNYVTGLEVVLADGRVMQLGGRALDPPEYDLTGLVVGSEGTLAVITRAYLRLIRNPPAVKTLMCSFRSDEEAGAAVSAVIAAGLIPAALEMMDQKVMGMIEAYVQVGLPVNAQTGLIVEVDGYPASLHRQIDEVAYILEKYGGYDLRIAQDESERQRIWYGRKSAAGAFSRLAPAFYLVDVTVPRSRLAEVLGVVNQICERYDLRVGHVFHAGDGNLHPAILCDPRDQNMMERVFAACDEIVMLCVEHDGSITGEHGVGIEKRKFMPVMYSASELATMLDVKKVFDGASLLNPGKIFPDILAPVQRATPNAPGNTLFAPITAEEAAAGLAGLAWRGKKVRIRSSPNGALAGASTLLSTHKLTGVRAFAPHDLYVTVGAGMPVVELHRFLAEQQMQTALVSPWPQATVGDLLSINLNSPQRIRYGSLRDALLCATVALPDGRVIRAGRPVVKNVAGYDLPKLFVGAHGTLGLLVDATLKLIPLPRARRTICLAVGDLTLGYTWAMATLPHLLVASGLVIASERGATAAHYKLYLTVEGLPEDGAAELEEVSAALHAAGAPAHVEAKNESAVGVWADFVGGVWEHDLLVRMGAPVSRMGEALAGLPRRLMERTRWLVDVPNGLVYAAFAPTDAGDGRAWLAALRTAVEGAAGYAVLVCADEALATTMDRWGRAPDSLPLMAGLKASWDPKGILNPQAFLFD
jgi:D-lactate dehydrogenase (cytochrome)